MVTTRSAQSNVATTSTPIAKLPVELLYLVARSLASFMSPPLPQRPGLRPHILYPLARTCKGFWACLRPLLYQLDVEFERDRRYAASTFWWPLQPGPPFSALVWGLTHNQPGTAYLAISAARSMGELHSYAEAAFTCELQVAWPPHRDVSLAPTLSMHLDAVFLAALQGNTDVVKELTEGASARFLNRFLSSTDARLPLSVAFRWYDPDHELTALHLATLGQHYDVVRVLLKRYAELDQSALQWYEPTGLHWAAFAGDVGMARLFLEGDSTDSPWVPRVQSQLKDPRAYCGEFDWTMQPRHADSPPPPPFIFAAKGITVQLVEPHARPQWCADEDAMFAFLASHDPGLPTRACPISITKQSPLCFALERFCFPTSPLERKRLLALLKTGALGIHHPNEELAWGSSMFFSSWSGAATTPGQCQFLGECWDAALEHYGGTPDTKFLAFWEHGIRSRLPDRCAVNEANALNHRAAVKLCLDAISLLDSKAPGFAQLPAIRGWLGLMAGQRATRQTMTHVELKEGWPNLF
jgi:ankyrin repeat protein